MVGGEYTEGGIAGYRGGGVGGSADGQCYAELYQSSMASVNPVKPVSTRYYRSSIPPTACPAAAVKGSKVQMCINTVALV